VYLSAINAAAAGAPWHLGSSYGRALQAFMPQPVEGHDLRRVRAALLGPRQGPTAPLPRRLCCPGSEPTDDWQDSAVFVANYSYSTEAEPAAETAIQLKNAQFHIRWIAPGPFSRMASSSFDRPGPSSLEAMPGFSSVFSRHVGAGVQLQPVETRHLINTLAGTWRRIWLQDAGLGEHDETRGPGLAAARPAMLAVGRVKSARSSQVGLAFPDGRQLRPVGAAASAAARLPS